MNRKERRAQISAQRKEGRKLAKNKTVRILLDIKNRLGIDGIKMLFRTYDRSLGELTHKELVDVWNILVNNKIDSSNAHLFVLNDKKSPKDVYEELAGVIDEIPEQLTDSRVVLSNLPEDVIV